MSEAKWNGKRSRCTSPPPVGLAADAGSVSTSGSALAPGATPVVVLGLDDSVQGVGAAANVEKVVVSAPVARPYLQNAEIQWKQFVYKASQVELAYFQSSQFDPYLDEVQSGERPGNPLVVPLSDDVFVSEQEMFSFLDYLVRGHHSLVNLSKLNIDGVVGGTELCLKNVDLPLLCRMCQLAAHFNLTPGTHHQFLHALRKRAPSELPILDALALAQIYVDPVLLRRTGRRLAMYVNEKKTSMAVTLINSISDATVNKLISVAGVGFKALPKRTKFTSVARQTLCRLLESHPYPSPMDTDSDDTSDEDDQSDEGEGSEVEEDEAVEIEYE